MANLSTDERLSPYAEAIRAWEVKNAGSFRLDTIGTDPKYLRNRLLAAHSDGWSGGVAYASGQLCADIDKLNAAATAFYKRVSARVPGLLDQIEDVAKPLRIALGMEDE